MRILSEEVVYRWNLFSLIHQTVDLGNDIIKTFELARRAPGTRLIIINEQWHILLSKEYRKETGNYDLRLPGGKVFDSTEEYENFLTTNQNIQEAAVDWAIKEAQEEVGIQVNDIEFFAKSISGATVVWDLYYFIVRDYVHGTQQLEHGENISYNFYDPATVQKMCLDGTIQEDRSAMMLMKFLTKHNLSK